MSSKLLRVGVLFLMLGGLAGCEGCEKPPPPATQLALPGGSGA